MFLLVTEFVDISLPAGAIPKYCDEYVRLSTRISPEPHARSLPNFLCVLPVSVAWSSSDMFIAIENALSAGKGGNGVHSAGKVCYLLYTAYGSCICFFVSANRLYLMFLFSSGYNL